jgi:hypothetical protein
MSIGMHSGFNYPPAMPDDPMAATLIMRVTLRDKKQLDALVSRLSLTPTHIARIALRVGMASIEDDPTLVFTGGRPAARAKGRKAPKGKP